MTISKKKETIQNGLEILNCPNIISDSYNRVDNVLKLFYKLFVYSIIGFLAKVLTKLFKFF